MSTRITFLGPGARVISSSGRSRKLDPAILGRCMGELFSYQNRLKNLSANPDAVVNLGQGTLVDQKWKMYLEGSNLDAAEKMTGLVLSYCQHRAEFAMVFPGEGLQDLIDILGRVGLMPPSNDNMAPLKWNWSYDGYDLSLVVAKTQMIETHGVPSMISENGTISRFEDIVWKPSFSEFSDPMIIKIGHASQDDVYPFLLDVFIQIAAGFAGRRSYIPRAFHVSYQTKILDQEVERLDSDIWSTEEAETDGDIVGRRGGGEDLFVFRKTYSSYGKFSEIFRRASQGLICVDGDLSISLAQRISKLLHLSIDHH